MIKYIITLAIIYFLVRSIVNKPWLDRKKAQVHQSRAPEKPKGKPQTEDLDGEFVDYEEVE